MLSSYESPQHQREFSGLNVFNYLIKGDSVHKMLETIRKFLCIKHFYNYFGRANTIIFLLPEKHPYEEISFCCEEVMTQLSWMAFPQSTCPDRLVPASFSSKRRHGGGSGEEQSAGGGSVASYLATSDENQRPAKIVVVDNDSVPAIVLPVTELPTQLLHCSIPGPAAARNLGAKAVDTEWILFIDSDCIPTPNLLRNYVAAQDGSIAYSGFVRSSSTGWIARYYETQEILIPMHDRRRRPQYLVTANLLVHRPALQQVNGFCEGFPLAAGEDIDLGFRLQRVGSLQYAEKQWLSMTLRSA